MENEKGRMIDPATISWSIVIFILCTGMLSVKFENSDDE